MSQTHLVFARKYRPQTFKEVVHQEITINAISNAFKSHRVGHAYLFFGPRGVGKTTIARIFAKRLNCENPKEHEPCNQCISCEEITRGNSQDVVEIDAASNRGIDNIRELRENVKFTPMRGKYRIYIIDEVHMLTTESFNALLKTLEEPPSHVVFILATTEFHKVPETILSRCQDFTFKKVPLALLQSHVEHLCKIENIQYDTDGLFWIAKKGDGSVRDTLSFLEQSVIYTDGKLLGKTIASMVGYEGVDKYIEIVDKIIHQKDFESVTRSIETLFEEGRDLHKFLWDFVEFTHAMLLVKENLGDRESINYPLEDIQKIQKAIQNIEIEKLNLLVEQIFHTYERLAYLKLRTSFEIKIFLEIQFRKLIIELDKPTVSGLLLRIKELSDAVQARAEAGEVTVQKQNPDAKPSSVVENPKSEPSIPNSQQSPQGEKPDVESIIMDKFSGTEVKDYPDIK